MTRSTRLTCAAVALLALLAGCGDPEPDLAACKTALASQLADAQESGAEGSRPDACDGVSDADLARLAGEVLAGATP